MSKQRGLDAIVLSEHDATWNRDDISALIKRHNFLILPGLEVTTEGGHILVYGVELFEGFMNQSAALADHVARVHGAMVAAHPYRPHGPYNWLDPIESRMARAKAVANPAYRHVDAIEVINGHGSIRENAFSESVARELGLPGTAGTDSHQFSDIGKAATYFDCDVRDEHDLIREIRAGRCWPVDLTSGSLTDDTSRHSVSSTFPPIFSE